MVKFIYPNFWQNRGMLACCLWPLSLIYFLMNWFRQIYVKPINLPAKVICVGNVSVGGSGKTQMVIWLAKYLRKLDKNFVIISNAYNSNLTKSVIVNLDHHYLDVGDEALILAKYGKVIACKKVRDSFHLISSLKAEIAIFDDRLQNPAFEKDLKILIIDEQRVFGNEFLLPAGPLRQHPDTAILAADLVISIGNDGGSNIDLESRITKLNDQFYSAKITPTNNFNIKLNYLAFCGIGNAERFFVSLKQCGLNLLEEKIYPDHHNYTDQDIQYLEHQATLLNAKLITTRKDYVKLPESLDIVCVNVELEFKNLENLLNVINEKIY